MVAQMMTRIWMPSNLGLIPFPSSGKADKFRLFGDDNDKLGILKRYKKEKLLINNKLFKVSISKKKKKNCSTFIQFSALINLTCYQFFLSLYY